ncbi:hypothetical protein Tco_1031476 [Tanacetum coccineum]|uniref:Uncharacterized protein n=1 Tax=Tanacetum coccineum TaxID=301880 RepID=A0ABQ5G9L0_9ASTR
MGRETGPKAFEGMPVDQLMEEFDMVTAQQATLVAQLRARFSSERSQSVQKDEEILLLKTQLASMRQAESAANYADYYGQLSLGCEEEKFAKLSIEYDEELYPHMLSAIAERRRSSIPWDVVKLCIGAWSRGSVEELHERKLLTCLPHRAASECTDWARARIPPLDVDMAGLTLA